MSVAVLCNLSDGVILGADSALTVLGANGVERVFEDGEKLFQLRKRIGIATFGVGGMGGRSIGSFLHEFDSTHPGGLDQKTIPEVTEELRVFFREKYVSAAETTHQLPFDQITGVDWPNLGLVVAGYSPNSFLSEAWEIQVPAHDQPNSARSVYAPGDFGLPWFARGEPIERYLYGISVDGLFEIAAYVKGLLGRDLTPAEIDELLAIRRKQGYQVMTDSMPIQTGIAYVRFLVNYVITHYRYTERHPVVGGKARIGVVTYKGEDFHILE